MRKLFVVLGLAIVAIPVGCMSDDSEQSARRPAAMAVREPVGYSHVTLSLEGSDTNWASYGWGVSANVVERLSTDDEGNTVYSLSAGATKPGTMTLERGLTTDSPQLVDMFRKGSLEFRSATVTLFAGDGSQIGMYSLTGPVVADLKHRSGENVVLETLTLRFAGSSLQL